MSNNPSFELPVITDQEIRWVAKLLKMTEDAFHGETGTDPRQDVLKSMKQMEVVACPGSGKTTLLVAKLAILADKWQHRTRGICVLSHTNAARHEIESRLGNTAAGQRLLAYPHFIGTIHAFVDEFLAVPWLRSRGFPIRMIDDDEVEKRRRSLIEKHSQFLSLRQFVKNKEKYTNLVGSWVVATPEFAVINSSNGEPAFKKQGRSASQLKHLVEMVVRDGYHRFGEMFMWAGKLMDEVPCVVDVLRDRFPMLFLDEAQDNSELQSQLLSRVFGGEDTPVIRQRFGDPNQAIFNSVNAKEEITDAFPDDKILRSDLPNSYRFGQKIADLADPLGLSPYGLEGQGPKQPLASGEPDAPHSVFLFDRNADSKVLEAYGSLLIDTFSDQELLVGEFVAIGQVHKPKGDDHRPRHVGHYWPDYEPELSKAEPKPRSFVQYVLAGRGKAVTKGEAYPAVEKIATGILRLAGMAEGRKVFRPSRYNHRQVMSYLDEFTEEREGYLGLVTEFAASNNAINKQTWINRWCETVRGVAEAVAGATLSDADAESFLQWKECVDSSLSPSDAPSCSDNLYRYSKDGRRVAIRVGSIHSAKGETHTATLVLETFWFKHNLEELLPWLNGSNIGGGSATQRQKNRLKTHYVAMTRPRHLLCLAMKRSTLENGDGVLDQKLIGELEHHGWCVKMI